MFRETLYQSTSDGRRFVDALASQNVLAGIKVDEGLAPLGTCEGETTTRGLENLSKKCAGYYEGGG